MAEQVDAPTRNPRVGGIKSVVGEFIRQDRMTVADTLAWEDAGCGLPNLTRAGCYDTTFYSDVVIVNDGNTYTFRRVGDEVTLTLIIVSAADIDGTVIAPWIPLADVSSPVTGGTITIDNPTGAVNKTSTPANGTRTITYAVAAIEKDFDGPAQYGPIVPPFAQYAGVECFLGGDSDGGSYEAQATALLDAGDERGVERKLWDWAIDEVVSKPTYDSIERAIGKAEKHADANYIGRPVLVMSRDMATLADGKGLLKREDDILVTANGTPVISTGVVPDDEESYIVITGGIAVWATPARSYVAPDLRHNRNMALAERAYSIGVDCDYVHVVEIV